MYITTYVVAGRGQFPWDMLRYDASYPTDGDSVNSLCGKVERRIRLSYKHTNRRSLVPTVDRWRSYQWKVDPTSIETIKV